MSQWDAIKKGFKSLNQVDFGTDTLISILDDVLALQKSEIFPTDLGILINEGIWNQQKTVLRVTYPLSENHLVIGTRYYTYSLGSSPFEIHRYYMEHGKETVTVGAPTVEGAITLAKEKGILI